MEEFANIPLSGEHDAAEAPETLAATESPPETQTAAETLSVMQAALETPSQPQAQATTQTPPGTQTAAESASETRSRERRIRRQQRRRWLRGFLCGAAVAGLLAVGGRLWEQRRAAPAGDRFVWDFREKFEESGKKEDLTVKIPAWPVGDGAAFKLLREHGETQSAQEVYRNVNPSVLTVIVELDDETAAVGTGVIFSDDGYFVTNYHVIQGGVKCRAMLAGAPTPPCSSPGTRETTWRYSKWTRPRSSAPRSSATRSF
ncbi:MAG: hypothetical protein IKN96_03825 [Oscillibacter sp.]|nr:hypothetical protein [Oscillibacter sp.]